MFPRSHTFNPEWRSREIHQLNQESRSVTQRKIWSFKIWYSLEGIGAWEKFKNENNVCTSGQYTGWSESLECTSGHYAG